MIRLDEVTVSLSGRIILRRVSAEFPDASISHLGGVNGSGKTSLIRTIAGLQSFTGTVTIDGARQSPRSAPFRWRAAAGDAPPVYVVFDDAPVYRNLSGVENLRMLVGRSLTVGEILGSAPPLVDRRALQHRAGELSHGQRKRLHLVAAFLSGARCLLLDEALDGLDTDSLAWAAESLEERARTATVVLTGHRSDAAADLAGHQFVLGAGRLAVKGALS